MRRIVHLSDVHFGTADPQVTEMAITKVNELEPHLVVVSGDLTQRARSQEFKQARQFLDRLPQPQVVVPGNHDVPLYNIFARFFRRLDKFQKYIESDLTPTYIDDEMAVVGINTARSLTIKGGRINDQQIEHIQQAMCPLADDVLKIVVTHHPFDLPEGFDEDDIVGGAGAAMASIAACGGDLFLAGHLHVSNTETTAKRYKLDGGRTALIVQAGTATSTRVRGEAHSFNVLQFDRPVLSVVRYECSRDLGFQPGVQKVYSQGAGGWERVADR